MEILCHLSKINHLAFILCLFGVLGCTVEMTQEEAENEMKAWIESELEFGQPPVDLAVMDFRKIHWPEDKTVKAFLVEYQMPNGEEYIGFTGPVTFSFADTTLSSLQVEDLYKLYTGWYVCFMSYRNLAQNKVKLGDDNDKMMNSLKNKGFEDINLIQNLVISDENYYEIIATKKGVKKYIAGTLKQHQEFSRETFHPLYLMIGEIWNPKIDNSP